MRNSFLLITLVLAALVTGCASVPMASLVEDARAKTFDVDPGMSNIYVYRNEILGGAITIPVMLDGKLAGKTGPETYFKWTVVPGTHDIASLAESTSKITINTKPGGNHFVWQEIKWGTWSPDSLLQEVSEFEGREAVNECKLIASEFDGGMSPKAASGQGSSGQASSGEDSIE